MGDKEAVTLRIGVLALQGGFFEHEASLMKALKYHQFEKLIEMEVVEVRDPENVADLDGLILPGGESTTMGLFLRSNGLDVRIREWIHSPERKAIAWGTCAGLILMSNSLEGQKGGGQDKLGGIDVTTSRNFFGRQLNSFEAPLNLKSLPVDQAGCHGVFIRAPAVMTINSPDVAVLATVDLPTSDKPVIVAVSQNNMMATAFHPELTEDPGWHAYFLQKVLNAKSSS
ncbi:predicted protein [Nematostella vectensis]|uniref:glutaminase n=1 Tax=Nematostella vectensis TaxID=45351 RepID=A7SXL4_NEMVE|nr:predicted protein [Nematostella vectensis]|eukprot:XP_001623663.1 predicted protein [Nematostella vectensis]